MFIRKLPRLYQTTASDVALHTHWLQRYLLVDEEAVKSSTLHHNGWHSSTLVHNLPSPYSNFLHSVEWFKLGYNSSREARVRVCGGYRQ